MQGSVRFQGSLQGSIDTWAKTILHPSGRRAQVWLWRPGVDHHGGQNIFLVGSTHLGMAALTVIMGSLTTWFSRSFMATLHSR
jgi:hypothetical protein